MAASSWKDPAFGMPLNFYLFDYPFYLALLNFLLALAFICALVFAISPIGGRNYGLTYATPIATVLGALGVTLIT